jgi:hypothetical protein
MDRRRRWAQETVYPRPSRRTAYERISSAPEEARRGPQPCPVYAANRSRCGCPAR